MKNLGKITEPKDIVTLEYLTGSIKNVIEQVRLGSDSGILCEKKAKDVIIPIASQTTLGLVKGSETESANSVLIGADGTLTIGRVEISHVFVPEGEELVLDGGDITKRSEE